MFAQNAKLTFMKSQINKSWREGFCQDNFMKCGHILLLPTVNNDFFINFYILTPTLASLNLSHCLLTRKIHGQEHTKIWHHHISYKKFNPYRITLNICVALIALDCICLLSAQCVKFICNEDNVVQQSEPYIMFCDFLLIYFEKSFIIQF